MRRVLGGGLRTLLTRTSIKTTGHADFITSSPDDSIIVV